MKIASRETDLSMVKWSDNNKASPLVVAMRKVCKVSDISLLSDEDLLAQWVLHVECPEAREKLEVAIEEWQYYKSDVKSLQVQLMKQILRLLRKEDFGSHDNDSIIDELVALLANRFKDINLPSTLMDYAIKADQNHYIYDIKYSLNSQIMHHSDYKKIKYSYPSHHSDLKIMAPLIDHYNLQSILSKLNFAESLLKYAINTSPTSIINFDKLYSISDYNFEILSEDPHVHSADRQVPSAVLPAGPRVKTNATRVLEQIIGRCIAGEFPAIEIDDQLSEVMLSFPGDVQPPTNLTLLFRAADLSHVEFSDKQVDQFVLFLQRFYPTKYNEGHGWLMTRTNLPHYMQQMQRGSLIALIIYTGPYRLNELANGKFTAKELKDVAPLIPFILTSLGIASQALRELEVAASRAGVTRQSKHKVLYRRDNMVWLYNKQGTIFFQNSGFTSTTYSPAQGQHCSIHGNSAVTQSIEQLSCFEREKEVLLAADTQFVLTAQHEMKFTARVINTPRQRPINYVVGNALRFAFKKRLSLDYQDQPYFVELKGVKVYRPNHGLVHTMKKVYYVDQVIAYFQKHAKDKNFVEFCDSLTNETLTFMKLILAFSVTGREGEVSFKDNPARYQLYKKASAKCFADYAKTINYTPETIDRGMQLIEHLCDPNYHPEGDDFYIYLITTMAHDLDTPRVTSRNAFDGYMKRYDDFIAPSASQQKDLKMLIEYAIQCMQVTGDAICAGFSQDGLPHTYRPQFFILSKSPLECDKALEQVQTPSFRTAVMRGMVQDAQRRVASEKQQSLVAEDAKLILDIEAMLERVSSAP